MPFLYTGVRRAALLLLSSLLSANAVAAEKTAADWQTLAKADIEAAHRLIVESHPGSIDERNPGFKEWTETGYRQALQLVPRVNSYDSMMSAARFYITGFFDGHLLYSDNARKDGAMLVNGWGISKQDGDYVVYSNMADWPAALPPIGARLIQCDGRSVAAILEEDVAPYIDRRPFDNREWLATVLTQPRLPDMLLKQCQFRTAGGDLLDLPVSYQPVSTRRYFEAARLAGASRKPGKNQFTFEDGVLWIRAASFNSLPSTEQIAEFNAMLDTISKLEGVRLIVFDVRGNGGGSSDIGDRIFRAATGGLEYDKQDIDKLPRTYAQWRVSDVLLSTAVKYNDEWGRRYGAESEQARFAAKFLKEVQDAKAKGQTWVEQVGGPLVTRADVARRNGKLRRFGRQVALLTDSRCASACLDFADQVLLVPGAIHLGRSTSADSLYLEAGRAKLPSGNVLVLPQKVWRNRLRGNNEVLHPGIVLKAAIDDDAAIRTETLAAIKK